MDMGVHCIDLMPLCHRQQDVKEVAAMHDTLTFHYEVEDSLHGAAAAGQRLRCAPCSPTSTFPTRRRKWRLEFFGDRGTAGRRGRDRPGGRRHAWTRCFWTDAMAATTPSRITEDVKAAEAALDVEFGNAYAREVESVRQLDRCWNNRPLEVPAVGGRAARSASSRPPTAPTTTSALLICNSKKIPQSCFPRRLRRRK